MGRLTKYSSLDYLDGRTMREFVVAFLRAGFTGQFSTPRAYFEACKQVFGVDQDLSSTAAVFLEEHSMTELQAVANAAEELASVSEDQWSLDTLKKTLRIVAESLSQGKYGNLVDAERLKDSPYAYATLMHWIRWALVRVRQGPSIIKTMSLYGRRVTLQKLEAAQQTLQRVQGGENESQATDSGHS